MDLAGIRKKIVSDIAEQQRLQDHCFRASEKFRWAAMVTSLLATLAVALLGGRPGWQWLAILPGLSSFFVGTERTFAFRQRSGWHCEKRIGLERILLDMDEGAELGETRRAILALDERMSGVFPHGSSPEQGSPDKRT